MRFGFITCVELGLSCMQEIDAVGGQLDLVVTLADDVATTKSGRVWVDGFVRGHGSELVKAVNVNDPGVVEVVQGMGIDWLFIIGWSQIAKRPLLQAPTRGVLGMHPTLLPEGRGRASIPWAILKELPETGVTLFKLDEGVDSGPIVGQERLALREDETAGSLYERVAEAHRTLIARHWEELAEDRLRAVAQDESKATVWPGRTPEDGRITPKMSTHEADLLVRASTRPYPGAFFDDESGRRLRIWAGRPASGEESYSGLCIRLGDGFYEATDFEWEVKQ